LIPETEKHCVADNQENTYLFEHEGKKYGRSDILEALRTLGITKGDALLVHSDLKSFGKINPAVKKNEYTGAFIDALKEAVGPAGTILMPCFSYTFCNEGEVYDPVETPSTMGILAERFRTLPDVSRTIDPIFSVAIGGKEKDYFMDVGTDCFGEGSIFEKIYTKKGKIVFFGPLFTITYMHFVEQRYGVPYRYMKEFSGRIKLNGSLHDYTFKYYVRHLDRKVGYNFEDVARFLDRQGVLKTAPLGYDKIRAVSAVDCYNKMTEGFKRDVTFLLEKT